MAPINLTEITSKLVESFPAEFREKAAPAISQASKALAAYTQEQADALIQLAKAEPEAAQLQILDAMDEQARTAGLVESAQQVIADKNADADGVAMQKEIAIKVAIAIVGILVAL